MDPWVRRLVDVAALRPADHVLDVACGTGFVARKAAEHVGTGGRVVGIDLNTGMIEAARATADGRDTIEWRTGDAAALPFADASFDVVLCQQGVQFFPDRLQGLREMNRVLRQGGRLAFTVWSAITDGRVPGLVEKRSGAFFRLVKCTTNAPPCRAATGGTRPGQGYQQASRSA